MSTIPGINNNVIGVLKLEFGWVDSRCKVPGSLCRVSTYRSGQFSTLHIVLRLDVDHRIVKLVAERHLFIGAVDPQLAMYAEVFRAQSAVVHELRDQAVDSMIAACERNPGGNKVRAIENIKAKSRAAVRQEAQNARQQVCSVI